MVSIAADLYNAESFLTTYPNMSPSDAENASTLLNSSNSAVSTADNLISCLDILAPHVEAEGREFSSTGVRHVADITCTSAAHETNVIALTRLLQYSLTDSRLSNKTAEISFELRQAEILSQQ